jgi:hypothetical protein
MQSEEVKEQAEVEDEDVNAGDHETAEGRQRLQINDSANAFQLNNKKIYEVTGRSATANQDNDNIQYDLNRSKTPRIDINNRESDKEKLVEEEQQKYVEKVINTFRS